MTRFFGMAGSLGAAGFLGTAAFLVACGPSVPPTRRIPSSELPLTDKGLGSLTLGVTVAELDPDLKCRAEESLHKCTLATPARTIPLDLSFQDERLVEIRLLFGQTPSTQEQCQMAHDILGHAESTGLIDRSDRSRGHTLVDKSCGTVGNARLDIRTTGPIAFSLELVEPSGIAIVILPGQK